MGNSRISLGSRPRRLLPSENEIWTKTGGHRSFPVRVISRSQVSVRCNKRERGQKRAEGTRRGWRVVNVQLNQSRSDRSTRSTESRFEPKTRRWVQRPSNIMARAYIRSTRNRHAKHQPDQTRRTHPTSPRRPGDKRRGGVPA